jgi:hypothetical protein
MKLLTLLLVLLVPTASGGVDGSQDGRQPLRGTPDGSGYDGSLPSGQVTGPTAEPRDERVTAGVPLQGWATYFDAKSGTAAAGPLLRSGDWRGRVVTVCAGSRCLVTALTDVCACGPRHGKPTLLDLAKSDFARLAPLSQGVVWVTVGRAELPATDMEAP